MHFLPAVVGLLVVNVFNVNSDDWRQVAIRTGIKRQLLDGLWMFTKIVPLFYILASFNVVYKSRQLLQQSNLTAPKTEYRIANTILLGFFIHWLWVFVSYAFGRMLSVSANEAMGLAGNYLTFLLVNGLFFFNLIKSRESAELIEVQSKVFSGDELDEKVKAIECGIHEQKLYLSQTINLDRFAEKTGLRPRDVTAVIKAHYHSNFLEFINGFRIEEAKRLLVCDEFKGESIEIIINHSGFNSSSAFHRAFKSIVQMTPSEYRKKNS